MGAMYTILNDFGSTFPVSPTRFSPIVWSIVSIATFVFPAPVGAHNSLDEGVSGEKRVHTHIHNRLELETRRAFTRKTD